VPVGKILASLVLGMAGLSVLIALLGLWHEFVEPGGLHELMHNLEAWVVTLGYHTALIILAAAGVLHLVRKH